MKSTRKHFIFTELLHKSPVDDFRLIYRSFSNNQILIKVLIVAALTKSLIL